MKIPNLNSAKSLFGLGRAFVVTHRPELLLGAGITATVASTILAARGGYKARGIVDAEQERRNMEEKSAPLTNKEKAQLTWQCYLPSAYALTGSLGSQVGLHFVHVKEKRALVLAGAAALEEAKTTYKRWEDEIMDHMTPEEIKKINDEIREENYDPVTGVSRTVNSDGVPIEKYLVRDNFTGRDIWSTQVEIEDALNATNNWINQEGDVELNHFYGLAGFDHIPNGDEIGWSGQLIDIKWDQITRSDGRPVRRFTFREEPQKDYTGNYA